MYLIRAQFKHEQSVVLEVVEDKELLMAICVNYAIEFGDDWKIWYVERR